MANQNKRLVVAILETADDLLKGGIMDVETHAGIGAGVQVFYEGGRKPKQKLKGDVVYKFVFLTI